MDAVFIIALHVARNSYFLVNGRREEGGGGYHVCGGGRAECVGMISALKMELESLSRRR